MKTCAKCETEKPVDQFNIKNKKTGTRNSYCKPCHSEYRKSHYQANRAKYIEKATVNSLQQKDSNMRRVVAYLVEHPCCDCGETNLDLLQFDHVEMIRRSGGRVFDLLTYSWERVEEEIAKCVVRCVSCHYKRTREQMGYRSRYEYL